MRQINRDAVDMPPRLVAVTSEEIAQVAASNQAQGGIYRHDDVTQCLRSLYLDKCYMCECAVDEDGVVEHFLPWHKENPERAYQWSNLHWSCDHCNDRKRRGPYCKRREKRPDEKGITPAIETLLIDPSAPPFCCRVDQLLEFDKELRVVAISEHAAETRVARTAEFLNDRRPCNDRLTRWADLVVFAYHANCKTEWEQLAAMTTIQPEAWVDPERSRWNNALNRADALYKGFLQERAPFHTAIRYALPMTLGLRVDDFKRMSEAYRTTPL
jgi:uncharacterized protein (TIGR02646 family)